MGIIVHKFREREFYFNETPAMATLIKEIFSDNYKVLEKNLQFFPGDIVLDIGANEGVFSIFMSKLFPQTRIFAYEPVPSTYFSMVRNIGLNACVNITPFMCGVGKPGQDMAMIHMAPGWSGGASIKDTFNPKEHVQMPVVLVTLDSIFGTNKIERCRLLKMDIEGAEYDALYNTCVLPKVEEMVGEFHINSRLEFETRRIDGLVNWVKNQTNLVHVEYCRMNE